MLGKRLNVMILSLFFLMGPVIAPSRADLVLTDQHVVAKTFNGTIEVLDPMGLIVLIRPDEKQGETQLLAFTDAKVFRELVKGEHVMVELDEHGMAKRIIKAEPGRGARPQ